MASYDELVRPFVSAPFGPGKQGTVSTPGVTPYVVVFVGGQSGFKPKVLTGQFDSTVTVYTIKWPKEEGTGFVPELPGG